MTPSNIIFRDESTLPTDSIDGNQTFGSVGDGVISPRAIAIVRAFISAYVAMPILNVLMV